MFEVVAARGIRMEGQLGEVNNDKR
jgi:hypothetical protein